MAGNETTTKFKVDISDLKKNIQEANRQIRLANAEFKTAAAGMDDWGKSVDGVSAKISQSEKVLKAQKSILADYEKQLELIVKQYGENSKEADEMRIKVENQRATVIKTEKSIKDYQSKLADLEAEQKKSAEAAKQQETGLAKLQKTISNQESALKDLKTQYANIAIEQGRDSDAAKALASEIEKLSSELEDNKKKLNDAQYSTSDLSGEQTQAKTAVQKLTETIDKQQSELDELKEKYKNVVLEQGENSDSAKELASQIDTLSGDLRENQNRLNDVTEAADDLDNSLDETSEGGVSTFSVALGNLIANVVSNAISKLKELVTETINVGKQFDSSMSQVAAVSGATGDEFQALRDKAKEMGATTQFTASEAADAFNYMAMAGWKTEQMIDGIPGVLNLAAASGTDLATTSDIVTDALTAMGYAAEDAGHLADVMAAASSNANTNVQMMGETFKYAAPVTGALGYSMEDTAIAVGLMANSGIKASSAGTALRGTLSRLTKPTKQMKTMMEKLGMVTKETITTIDSDKLAKAQDNVASKTGAMEKAQLNYNAAVAKYGESSDQARKAQISLETASRNLAAANKELEKAQEGKTTTVTKSIDVLKDENGEMRSLMEVMQLLREKMGDLDEAQQAEAAATLFGQEAMSGMLAIINASDEDFNKLTKAVNESEGAAESMAKAMQDNLGGDMTKLGSQFEGVQLAIYEKFEPALRKGVEALSKLLDVFSWLIDNGTEVATVIIGVGTAVGTFLAIINRQAILTAFIGLLSKLKAGFIAFNAVLMANPIALVASLIAGLVAAFVYLWNKSEKFRNFWKGLWESIQEVAGKVIEAVVDFFKGAWDKIKSAWDAVAGFFSGIWDSIQESASNLIENIVGFFKGAWEKIKAVWDAITGFFSYLWESIKSIFSSAANAVIDFFKPVITFFTEAWNIIKELAEGCWNLVKAVWSAVGEWFNANVIQPVVNFFNGLWKSIKDAAQAAWDFIKSVWKAVSEWFNNSVIQPVKQFFIDLWNGIKNAASAAWTGIKNVWNAVSGWFKNTIIQPVSNFFTGMWDGLKNGAKAAWDGIKSVFGVVVDWFKDKFSKAWQAVKDVFSAGGKVFDGIKEGIVDAFKTVVNAIIRGINKVIAIPFNAINGILEKIQNVSILGVEPFKNLIHRFSVPEIPQLARGGVLKRGQVGLLEGDGAEAVVPLENNKRWIAATAAELKKALISEGVVSVNGGSTSSVVNNYNFTQNNTSPKALSRLEIYRQSKNLLHLKGAT